MHANKCYCFRVVVIVHGFRFLVITASSSVPARPRRASPLQLPGWFPDEKTLQPEHIVFAVLCALFINIVAWLIGIVFTFQTDEL